MGSGRLYLHLDTGHSFRSVSERKAKPLGEYGGINASSSFGRKEGHSSNTHILTTGCRV